MSLEKNGFSRVRESQGWRSRTQCCRWRGHKLLSEKLGKGRRGEEGRAFEEESRGPVGMQEKVTRGRNLARKRQAFYL